MEGKIEPTSIPSNKHQCNKVTLLFPNKKGKRHSRELLNKLRPFLISCKYFMTQQMVSKNQLNGYNLKGLICITLNKVHKTRFLFFILLKTYNFFLPYHYQQFLLIISDRHLNSFPILILVFEQPMSSSSPLHPPFMLATESILPYWVEREPAAQTKQLPTPKYSVQTASGGSYSYC